MNFEVVLCSVLKCKNLLCYLRLPLYFVVPICVSEESILKYEGRGIPVSIYLWLRVRNLIEKTKFQLAFWILVHIIFKTYFL